MNDAARALIEAGLFVGVAAGNFNEDASNRSPGAEPLVCTVGASDSFNNRADFSNFGELMDIYAPGKYVGTIDRFGAPVSSALIRD
jgi:subtilisin family serine protease